MVKHRTWWRNRHYRNKNMHLIWSSAFPENHPSRVKSGLVLNKYWTSPLKILAWTGKDHLFNLHVIIYSLCTDTIYSLCLDLLSIKTLISHSACSNVSIKIWTTWLYHTFLCVHKSLRVIMQFLLYLTYTINIKEAKIHRDLRDFRSLIEDSRNGSSSIVSIT